MEYDRKTILRGNDRLIKAADLVERSVTFDQSTFLHQCDTPACVLGHYAMATPQHWVISGGIPFLKPTVEGGDENGYFGITPSEVDELFGRHGCGHAYQNGKKAARYIRAFVAVRVAQCALDKLRR